MKNYRNSILIACTVFLTSEENRIVVLLTTWLRVGKGAKGLFGFYIKKKKSFSGKKHETKRRTALTHYLSQIA